MDNLENAEVNFESLDNYAVPAWKRGFIEKPWLYTCPDGLASDLHPSSELEQAWNNMVKRIKELEEK